MSNTDEKNFERLVPQLPPKGHKLRLLIDTDAANEIDDLYAIALALVSPDRFAIEGFIATHYAHEGPETIGKSYSLLIELLKKAHMDGKYPVKRSAHPMQYLQTPSEGEGVDFIIERAHCGSSENPLWVVGLGAATNLASAVLKDPTILPKVRCVFHSRSSHTWPERSVQFNVAGDVIAARALLASRVPLVWFDTGTDLKCSFEDTEKYVAPTGDLGKFIHEYRLKRPQWQTLDKGFFDLGDIAWMINPDLCCSEVVEVPTMDQCMFFHHTKKNGKMLRIFDIDNTGTWKMFFERLANAQI
jgi:purine nucleosidase